jgi:hypothetical protein
LQNRRALHWRKALSVRPGALWRRFASAHGLVHSCSSFLTPLGTRRASVQHFSEDDTAKVRGLGHLPWLSSVTSMSLPNVSISNGFCNAAL